MINTDSNMLHERSPNFTLREADSQIFNEESATRKKQLSLSYVEQGTVKREVGDKAMGIGEKEQADQPKELEKINPDATNSGKKIQLDQKSKY